jgi:vacuolar-type H+-ATPase subunit E/Vma4
MNTPNIAKLVEDMTKKQRWAEAREKLDNVLAKAETAVTRNQLLAKAQELIQINREQAMARAAAVKQLTQQILEERTSVIASKPNLGITPGAFRYNLVRLG